MSSAAPGSAAPPASAAVAISTFRMHLEHIRNQLGVGAAAAFLIDAFLIRGLLVPTLMCVLGSANFVVRKPTATPTPAAGRGRR